jgi:hypothetical protein
MGSSGKDKGGDGTENFGDGAFITIDTESLVLEAKKYDYAGRDLVVELTIDLGTEQPVNFVSVDPVLFNPGIFAKVIDLSTAPEDGAFVTVEGFDKNIFDKTLTQEANKQLPKEIQKALGPDSFSYQGMGVFSFPREVARKIKMTLMIEDPIDNVYERLHVLMQEKTKVTETVSSKKKKGW